MSLPENRQRIVRDALVPFEEIAFAILFGSAVSGRLRGDSDLDVAVYGASGRHLEIETERELLDEAQIQLAVERATDRNVDLLVLNRAPAVVCAAAMSSGRPLFIRDSSAYSRFFLAVTDAAIDFYETEREWQDIRERSASLSAVDRSRLERIFAFLDDELADAPSFENVTQAMYLRDRALRRNLDRWIEILINAVIDIAKIVQASEHLPIPRTYAQILDLLPSLPAFSSVPPEIRNLASLRNVMAHEYLDLRFVRIRRFIDSDIMIVHTVIDSARTWMEQGSL